MKGTGALQSAVKCGIGNDTVVFRRAISAAVATDEGPGPLRGVETILFYTGGLTLNVMADRTTITSFGALANTITIAEDAADFARITLAGGNDRVVVGGTGHRIDTGGGADRVGAFGAGTSVAAGRGDDRLDANGTAGMSQFDTGGGNDVANLSGSGRLTMGTGNDVLYFNGGTSTMGGGGASADMGWGNDTVYSRYYSTLDGGVNLGGGADVMVFRGTVEFNVAVTTGFGADTLVFEDMELDGSLRTDFNARQDKIDLSFFDIDTLADATRITQVGANSVLFFAAPDPSGAAGLELILTGVQVSQLTDAIFV